MIATAVVLTGLPPETFGVENSIELGEEILIVLTDRARNQRLDALRQRLSRGA